MSRFKQRPIAAAVILMLSGAGPALAQAVDRRCPR